MRKLIIIMAAACLTGGSAFAQMGNYGPQNGPDPGKSKITQTQQVSKMDYDLSKAITNLSKRQMRRIHRLDKKYIRNINKEDDNGSKQSMGMGGGPMGEGMGGESPMGGGGMNGGFGGGMGGGNIGNMDGGGQAGIGNAKRSKQTPKELSKNGKMPKNGSQVFADSIDFEAIEKIREAKANYEKSLKKILTKEQFGQYKAYERTMGPMGMPPGRNAAVKPEN